MRLTAWLSTCALLLGAAAPARAAPHDPGTHFMAELDGGALLTGDSGPAFRAALGAGGKFRGFPLRFYLLGQLGASSYVAGAPASLAADGGTEHGAFEDLALGPRVVLPIHGPLRLYVEALGGASLASARHLAPGRPDLYASEWLGLLQLSAGLQWRVLYPLSLGVRVSAAFNQAGLAGVARYAGVHDTARLALTGGATWHF